MSSNKKNRNKTKLLEIHFLQFSVSNPYHHAMDQVNINDLQIYLINESYLPSQLYS